MSEEQVPQKKGKGGRPTNYHVGLVDRVAETPDPATLSDIADYLGVGARTVSTWMTEHEEFQQAVYARRALADDKVEKSLFDRALGYTEPVREQRPNPVTGEPVDLTRDVHVPADVRAAQFWLQNRRPAAWRNQVHVEVKGKHVDLVERAIKILDLDPSEWEALD